MLLDTFVDENRETIIGEIRRIRNHFRLAPIRPEPVYTHQDLVLWVLNDDELYQLALAHGVEGI